MANLGSICNSLAPDVRASNWPLDAGPSGPRLQQVRAGYDHEAVIDQFLAQDHPSAACLIPFQRGEHWPPWRQAGPQ